jgi:hypothetical protein
MAALPYASPVDAIRSALQCGKSGCPCARSANVHCPVHEDRDPSFTVHASGDLPLVHCKGGCSQSDVIAALKMLGVWPEPSPNGRVADRPQTLERHTALYQYITSDGELVGEKGRWDAPDGSKRFAWRKPGVEGWPSPSGIKVADMPLWGAELLAAHEGAVIFTEGEKAAQACRDHGALAVCFGGGASSTDFGTSLEVLRHFDVLVWPDNDAQGRTYMARVHALLQPIAKSVRILEPPVKESGDDAVEFFERGGTLAELLADLPPVEWEVRELADNGYLVQGPTPMGAVAITFADMEKSGRELACEIEVQVKAPGQRKTPYRQRLNLLSGSQRTELKRDLNDIYGKGYEWPVVLMEAVGRVQAAFLNKDRSVRLREIEEPAELQYCVETLVLTGRPTVIYGNGSSGKTYGVERIIAGVASGRDVCGFAVQRGACLYIDYEADEGTFRYRMGRVLRGMGLNPDDDFPIDYWDAKGAPLHDQIDAIKAKVERDGIVLVVIDAAADACGGEPESAAVALRFFNALGKLPRGVAKVVIAHITNAAAGNEGIVERPFGSQSWFNRPGLLWFVARQQDEESDVIEQGWYNTKINDGRKHRPIGMVLTFEGKAGPVLFERGDIQAAPELQRRRGLQFRIYDVLTEPRTVESIASLTESKPQTVAARLREHPQFFERAGDQGILGGRGHVVLWQRKTRR